MSRIFMRLGIAAGTLLLTGGGFAYPLTFCESWAANAVKQSQAMRALAQSVPGGTCTGHDLLDPFWSTNSIRQRRWCSSVSRDTANTRTAEMNAAFAKCGYCAGYANILTNAAAENQKLGCGFKDDGDARWSGTAVTHFQGCMTVQECDEQCSFVVAGCYNACLNFDGLKAKIMEPIVSQVTTAIEQCKIEKNIRTSSSPLTVPKAVPPLRDSVGRAKHQGNAIIKSHNDLAAPARPSNRRTPARETAITAKHDHTPSLGRARSRPPSPCTSANATKPCSAGSNTAIDRLSGDNRVPSSGSSSSRIDDGGRGRLPSGGGASAVAKPVTPSALPTADPTSDFGKCASCGKPPAPPR